MTRLRESLRDLAEEAPPVNLADAAIAGHRRRRRALVAVTAAAAVVVVAAATVTTVELLPRPPQAAAPQRVETVADLPDGKVGPVGYAYLTSCEVVKEPRHIDCGASEWRVVTRSGTTYRVPRALAATSENRRVQLAISRDGGKIAYYDREAGAHVVRDLMSGAEVTSPVTVAEDRIKIGSQLVLSDDGRYLFFDPKVGSKDPGMVIDVHTGNTVSVSGKYEAISIKNGVVELVRYRKTDMWLMPVTGGRKPVRFDGVFIHFSEIAPDGRTLVASEFKEATKPVLTVLDAKTGRTVRKVEIRGLPKDAGYLKPSVWRSPSEVMVLTMNRGHSTYSVNVETGKATHLAGLSKDLPLNLAMPGAASGK